MPCTRCSARVTIRAVNAHDDIHPRKGGSLPNGWYLIDRFDGDHAVILDFQRGGDCGPRVTGYGTTFEAALQFGLKWMQRYDERDQGCLGKFG